MSVLVLGSSGQLATHLRQLIPDAVYVGRNTLDLADPTKVAAAVESLRPTAIINAAGYTAVDKAESEPALAWNINAESVAALARAATSLDVPLLQVSTDYVFDGRKTSEYEPVDAPNPISIYGATKLAGDLAAQVLCRKSWILRVSWVFSEHGANFVKTILRLAGTRDELRVVADQYGRPTYAGQLAAMIAEMVRQPDLEKRVPYGTYNAVGGPIVTWHQFADAIVEEALSRGLIPKRIPVLAITTSEYPTAARRPANSALKPSIELAQAVGVEMDWRKGLTTVLTRL